MKIRKTLLRILEVIDEYGNCKYYPVIQRELKFPPGMTYRRYLTCTSSRFHFETIQEYARRVEVYESRTKEGALHFNTRSACDDFCISIKGRLQELEERRNSRKRTPFEGYTFADKYTIYSNYD